MNREDLSNWWRAHRPGHWRAEARYLLGAQDGIQDRLELEREAAIATSNQHLQYSRDVLHCCARLMELAARHGATREEIYEATAGVVVGPLPRTSATSDVGGEGDKAKRPPTKGETVNDDYIELPIETVAAKVVMRPYQVKRDLRRRGATSRAAVRLGSYYLRRFIRDGGRMPISDTKVHVGANAEDFIRNRRTIVFEVRCVDRLTCDLHGISEFRVPDDRRDVVILRPPPRT